MYTDYDHCIGFLAKEEQDKPVLGLHMAGGLSGSRTGMNDMHSRDCGELDHE